ncbi:MAG: CHAT domain-containing protein [Pseudomonadota bacterium]
MVSISGRNSPPTYGDIVCLSALGLVFLAFCPTSGSRAQSVDAQPQPAVTALQLESSVEESLKPGTARTYELTLPPGVFLLTLEQQGLDYSIHVNEPVPQVHDSPTFRDDRETLVLEPVSQTRYVVNIQSDEYTGVTGTYRLGVEPLTVAEEIGGFRAMASAVAALSSGVETAAQSALDLYSRALERWERIGNVAEQARTLLSIAQIRYWYVSDWQGAASAAADAALLYRSIGRDELFANARSLQAAALIESAYQTGQDNETDSIVAAEKIYEEALRLFAEAANVQEASERWYDRAQTLNNIGLTWHNRGRRVEAVPFYQEAAEEFRRLEEWAAEMNPLANLAVIDQDSGRLVRASTTQERLLEIIPPDREPAWRADTLDNYANARLVLGDADTALSSYLEALAIHESINDAKGQGFSMTGIGWTYRVIGEIDRAEDYFLRALPIRRAANDGAGQMTLLRSLSEIDIGRGNFDAALEKLEAASRIATSEAALVQLSVRKAEAWIATADYARAAQVLDQGRQVAERTDSARDLADILFWTGKLATAQGRQRAAATSFDQAETQYRSLGVSSGVANSRLELGKLSHAAGDYAAAQDYAALAIESIEGLRAEVTNPELRAVYLGARMDFYDLQIDSLFRADQDGADVADNAAPLALALEAAERAKARATVDLINEARIDLSSTVDSNIVRQLNESYASLAEAEYQRIRLIESGQTGGAALEDALERLLRIRAELDVLETQARNSHPHYAAVQSPRTLQLAEIQASLESGDLLLQYWLGDMASYLWVVDSQSIRGIELGSAVQIDDLARGVHQNLSSGRLDPAAKRERERLLDELSRLILHEASAEIRNSRRMIVAADGALRYLPFALLTLPDGRQIVESHEVVSVPSMTVIAAQREILRARGDADNNVALIGDPVFEQSDPRVGENVDRRLVVDLGQPGLPLSFSRLPFSGSEIEQIGRLVPDENRFVATGLDARKEAVAGDSLKDFRYVHLATHGVIDASQPVLSSLVLSMVEPDGTMIDGHLRLRDIYAMDLSADLVVLSACETALGREIRGEGLVGLTQGFLYAGAKSVAASLWQVPDRATAELMGNLYTNMLVKGQSPAAALKDAQLELAKNRRWQDPYFWGGFMLIGDWH